LYNINISLEPPCKSTAGKPHLNNLINSMRSYFCFNRILAGVIVLLTTATLFFACTKTVNDPAPHNVDDTATINAASDQAVVGGYYDDLFSVALQVVTDANFAEAGRKAQHSLTTKLGGCLTYSVDDVTYDQFPKTITVDFGDGCADSDGRIRAGQLQIILNGYMFYPGTVVTIKPLTYSVDGVAVSGTRVITNQSTNDVYQYNAVVTGGSIKLDTITVQYSSNRTIKQTDGLSTLDDVSDDEYAYTGIDSLTYPTGKKAVITVKDSVPLVRSLNCAWISKGQAQVQMNSITAVVDYGNGVCDDSVSISIGDKVKFIALPK
jgi:hypothetical protein